MKLPSQETMSQLSSYIAPHIIGNELIKELLTLQMFSNPESNERLHYLVVGGSSTGKSDLAQFINKVMLGRSAIIQKEATPKGAVEKLIRSSGGLVYIDELDKTKKELRMAFLEAMQNGTVTIDKHGEHYTYPAKVNICGLCNPPTPELIREVPLQAQLSFTKDFPLLSRFHFFLAIYPADSSSYPNIAERMVLRDREDEIINKLREIVITTKQNIPTVKVSEDLARKIGEYVRYLKDINISNSVLITPRLIDGFINATKARSRMMQRDKAQESDFEYCKMLYEKLSSQ